ncbi:MAG: hypothetical protein ABIF19_13410 [Planctomycetota bacterium]
MNAEPISDDNCSPVREYSAAEALINNVPYIAMTVLGAAIFAVALGDSAWGPLTAVAYLAYGAAGSLWIMVFVCPYCRYWNSSECPCGYGLVAARFRPKAVVDCFDEKFKKHIPVIVPLWILPLLAGLPDVVRNFSWLLLALLVLFAIDAFAVLPLVSTKHGCKECPQKDSCPWIIIKSKVVG